MASTISGILGIVLAQKNFGVWSLVVQNISSIIITIIVLNFSIDWKPKFEFSMNSVLNMFDYGWKILISDLSGVFFMDVRSLIIGKFYSNTDLALYNKGQQFSKIVCDNVNVIVPSVLFPIISDKNDKMFEVKSILRESVQMLSYICFPIMVGTIAISNELITFLLTDKWAGSVIYIKILSVGYTAAIIGTCMLQGLKAIGKSDSILKAELIKKPVFIILLILSVRKSIIWVALAMSFYDIYGSAITLFQIKKHIGYNFGEQIKDIFSPLIMSLIMYCAINMINLNTNSIIINLASKIIIGMAVYIFMSILNKNQQFKVLNEFLKRKLKGKKYD